MLDQFSKYCNLYAIISVFAELLTSFWCYTLIVGTDCFKFVELQRSLTSMFFIFKIVADIHEFQQRYKY